MVMMTPIKIIMRTITTKNDIDCDDTATTTTTIKYNDNYNTNDNKIMLILIHMLISYLNIMRS